MLGSANSNAQDSLGEVDFFLGDFSGAEKNFLEARASLVRGMGTSW